jgi:predicted metal-dependent HD superfamily phosphohydrolase
VENGIGCWELNVVLLRTKMNVSEAEKYAVKLLEEKLPKGYTYHNLRHTVDVATSSERIARIEGVSEEDILLIQTASYFHDIGIIEDYHGHEVISAEMAKNILPEFGYTSNEISVILKLILATQMPQIAHNTLEQIICDADLDYLGREDYFNISTMLRQEWINVHANYCDDKEWYGLQKEFLTKHVYHTKAAQKLRNAGKEQNLQKINSIIENLTS